MSDEPEARDHKAGEDSQHVHILFVQPDASLRVDQTDDEPLVMTFPHLILRESIAVLALSLVLVVLSLTLDAPLAAIADPTLTPDPVKAPWYFVGLQELLHYYPPVLVGVLMPLMVTALVVIPYVTVNIERRPLWEGARALQVAALWGVLLALAAALDVSATHTPWPLFGTLFAIGLSMSAGALPWLHWAPGRWLATRSLPFWIFTWFLLSLVTLSLIGGLFRGSGWTLAWPGS